MSTAVTPLTGNAIEIIWESSVYSPDGYHIYMHFEELQPLESNETRIFGIKFNGEFFSKPFQPDFLSALSRAEELETMLKKFDSNGDGKICTSELADVLSELGHPASDIEIREMMAEADSDGNGFIDLGEFMELNTRDVDDAVVLEDLREVFGCST
ncbi:putative calcium-binding protein CML25 [Acorus calamus]|uniref:Calcium-binding protein CML25 n=1 Tax=Acorus calamus TaxID=4465 RepID=A0AAV9CJ00_ACOCL|nr:putative calcium-binding protein CML25 [Acorus calamus]